MLDAGNPRLGFDPFDPAYLQDPYPALAALTAARRPAYAPDIDMWVVSGYAAIDAIFRDPATFSAAIAQDPLCPVGAEAKAILQDFRPSRVMSNADPPLHGRIRAHTVRAFSPRRVAVLEPAIRARAGAMIENFAGRARVDLVRDLAFPLPAATIFTMIGFPDDDVEQLKSYCAERMSFSWGRPTPSDQARIAGQMVAYWDYCVRFVERRAREPADDLTSDLLASAREHPETLDEQQIASIIYGLSFAGHETTTNLIANTVRRLLEHPDAWIALCTDPARIPDAVEEALRFDTSVISWRRVTTKPATVGDVELPQGAKLLLMLAAANHDPERFPNPERFDIDRDGARNHLSFGMGIHFCLGASLARLEVAIVVELLTRRFPTLALESNQQLTFHPNVSFRGPRELWVRPQTRTEMALHA